MDNGDGNEFDESESETEVRLKLLLQDVLGLDYQLQELLQGKMLGSKKKQFPLNSFKSSSNLINEKNQNIKLELKFQWMEIHTFKKMLQLGLVLGCELAVKYIQLELKLQTKSQVKQVVMRYG